MRARPAPGVAQSRAWPAPARGRRGLMPAEAAVYKALRLSSNDLSISNSCCRKLFNCILDVDFLLLLSLVLLRVHVICSTMSCALCDTIIDVC